MATFFLSVIYLAAAVGGQDGYYNAVNSTSGELQNQLDFLRRSFATIPGPPEGRGFNRLGNRIFIDLITFRQLVQTKAPREDLYLAFTKVDMEMNELLNNAKDFEKWDPAIQMAARRAQSALHDTSFAMATGDASPALRTQNEARQAQVLRNREQELENMVGIVFLFDTDALKKWNPEFAGFKKNIAELQRLQKDKASRDDLKKQLAKTDQSWETLVTRFKGLSTDQAVQLREDFGQVDQVISRLSVSYGIKDRRASLKTNFLR